MAGRIAITEESGIHQEWFKEAANQDLETLPLFLKKLAQDYSHDYGTSVHAVSAAAVAAAWAMNRVMGLTGYQAQFVMWGFIKAWNCSDNKLGLKLLNYDDVLYPQYLHKFENTLTASQWEKMQARAAELIAKVPDAHPAVKKHWESIRDGKMPSGFRVE